MDEQKNEKNQEMKLSRGAWRAITFFIVSVGLVLARYEQRRQEKLDAAYEIGHELLQRQPRGSIDVENATLRYPVPDGYVYSEQNSTDKSKMYIAEDGSRAFCISLEKMDKRYTELDVDLFINNNFGSGYAKSVEMHGHSIFYVYRYSGNSESGKNEEMPVSVSKYVYTQGFYIVYVDDILYGEENNSRDLGYILYFDLMDY